MNTILGKKVQQTQAFLENGNRIPVTLVDASDNPVTGVKTIAKDGYAAVQIGFGTLKNPTKPLLGHAKKASLTKAPQVIREIRGEESFQLGDIVKVEEVLQPGDIVDVTGKSKGKGFAGGVKRHQFKGGPKTHGQSDRHRAPGSIGSGTTPGRVYRGKRMAGNMGNEQVTVKNLMVVGVDAENKTLTLKGLVPGVFGGVITITKTGAVKEKNYVPLFSTKEPQEEVVEVIEEPVQEASVQEEVKTEEVIAEVAAEEPQAEAPVETEKVESTEEVVKEEEAK